jgi:hypothetical protein
MEIFHLYLTFIFVTVAIVENIQSTNNGQKFTWKKDRNFLNVLIYSKKGKLKLGTVISCFPSKSYAPISMYIIMPAKLKETLF